MAGFVLVYLLMINAVAFAAFAIDKGRAVRAAHRIPEFRLLQIAAAGGVFGAIAAQRLLRHKTRKEPFRTRLMVVAVVETTAAVILIAWWLGRGG